MTKTTKDTRRRRKTATRLVHSGRDSFEHHGFVNTPVYRGSTVLFPTVADFEGHRQPYTYGTKGTPTSRALEEAWSELSGAETTALVPSGLAAVALALLTACRAGGHALISDSAYQPTRSLCEGLLKRFGVEAEYYDPRLGTRLAERLRPNTCAILAESPGSLTMEMQDIPALAEAAQARGACLILDNTWATPLFFPPHVRGVDLAIDAGTKYLSGHADLLLGLVSANAAWAKRLRATHDAMANCAGSEEVFLALRGLRTMELRLRAQERAALDIARWLETRPEVARVLHPALPAHPDHALWARDYLGAAGVFSVILKPVPKEAVAKFIDALELFGIGYSWGGYESLVIPFDARRARTATQWAPEGPALRFSIGLEDIEDLKADLSSGMKHLSQ